MHRSTARCVIAATLTAALAAPAAAADPASDWRQLDAQNTLVIDTTRGRIVVAMRPDFAPQSVARVKLLSRDRVYDGLLFHRVIEGFVDQTGNPNNYDGGVSRYANLPPELTVTLQPRQIDAIATRSGDGITGFVGATPFAAVRAAQPGAWRAWGIYCDGVAGMGRQEDIYTANSEIFFMRGRSRRLDHDYAVWGRVVQGLDVVRAISVGEPPAHPDKMLQVRVMADLPAGDQPKIQLIDTASPAFQATLQTLRRQQGADFTVCDVPIPVRTDK